MSQVLDSRRLGIVCDEAGLSVDKTRRQPGCLIRGACSVELRRV